MASSLLHFCSRSEMLHLLNLSWPRHPHLVRISWKLGAKHFKDTFKNPTTAEFFWVGGWVCCFCCFRENRTEGAFLVNFGLYADEVGSLLKRGHIDILLSQLWLNFKRREWKSYLDRTLNRARSLLFTRLF